MCDFPSYNGVSAEQHEDKRAAPPRRPATPNPQPQEHTVSAVAKVSKLSTHLSTQMPWNSKHGYKRITFTINLPDGKTWEDYDLSALRVRLGPTLNYLLMGFEGGTEKTPRKHFQGYLEYSKKKLGSAMDNAFRTYFPLPISVHYEISSGSAEQNEKYCKGYLPDGSLKDLEPNKFFEWGTPAPGQGSRSDLANAFSRIKQGATDVELAEESPQLWGQYRKALSEYRTLIEPKRTWPTQLVFLWGPTGNGKTAQAMLHDPMPTAIEYRDPFITGLVGSSETVLFDDFDWKRMPPKYWLKLVDRYPMSVEVKGGSRNWAPKTIIFTSNDDPKTWWPEAPPETLQAVHRRMDEFGKITLLGAPVPHTQRLLSAFFTAPTAPASAASSGAAKRPAHESDSEDDWATHSQPSQYEVEHGPKGKQPRTVIDLTQ